MIVLFGVDVFPLLLLVGRFLDMGVNVADPLRNESKQRAETEWRREKVSEWTVEDL